MQRVVSHLTADRGRWHQAMVHDELGWSKTRTSIRGEKRVQIGISVVVGGLIQAIPVFLSLPQVEWWAYGLTALTALVLGAVKARYTRQRPV